MPTLRVVPEPQDGPQLGARAIGAAEPVMVDAVPTHWFPCVDPSVGAAVRTHLLTVLNAWAVDTDTMADAMVLVSELVANVRDHTASESLGVRVTVTADRVVVAIVEQHRSDPPDDDRRDLRTAIPVVPDRRQDARGRGLRILDSVASEWGFVRTGGVSTGWFALPAAPPVTPAREPEIRRF